MMVMMMMATVMQMLLKMMLRQRIMRMMMVTMIHFLDLVYTALKYQNPFHNLTFFSFITQCVHLHREKASMYTCGASYIACIDFLTGTWRLQLTSSVYPQFTFSLPTLYRKFSLILSSHPHPPHALPSPFPTPLPTPLAPRRPRTSAERTPTVGGAPSLSRPVMQISQQPAGVRPQARLYCLLARGINSGNMCIIQHHGFRAH